MTASANSGRSVGSPNAGNEIDVLRIGAELDVGRSIVGKPREDGPNGLSVRNSNVYDAFSRLWIRPTIPDGAGGSHRIRRSLLRDTGSFLRLVASTIQIRANGMGLAKLDLS